MRKKSITIDDIQSLISNGVVHYRDINPNYVHVTCNLCNTNRKCLITSIRQHGFHCLNCKETLFETEAKAKGLEIVSKDYRGLSNSCDYRRYKIIACGHEHYRTLSSIRRSNAINCDICHTNDVRKIIEEKDFIFIQKPSGQKVEYKCKRCNKNNISQISNIKYGRNICCKFCKNKTKNKSYVYLFELSFNKFRWLKIGKSNNPYLRHLNFNVIEGVAVKFITQYKFETEEKALLFEKGVKFKYRDFALNPSRMKNYLTSGYTECFNIILKKEIEELLSSSEKHDTIMSIIKKRKDE